MIAKFAHPCHLANIVHSSLLSYRSAPEPVVITGIGLIASVGDDRESVWKAVRQGKSGVQRLRGLPGIPDDMLVAAQVDVVMVEASEFADAKS